MIAIIIILFCLYTFLFVLKHILNKILAEKYYQMVKCVYEDLLSCRRSYYQAKFIENSFEKQELISKCIANHKRDLEVLSNPSTTKYIRYLSKEKREDLEETLALPRYELI